MAVNQEHVSKILSALSHPLRRAILKQLYSKDEGSFTELMTALNVDTGLLSFHIRNLEMFLEQTPTGKYTLNEVGENAIRIINDVEDWTYTANVPVTEQDLAQLSHPVADLRERIIAFLIDFGIAIGIFMLLPTMFFLLELNIFFFLILFWIYLTLLEGFAGQTLGKRFLRLKVVRIDGKKLFYDYAAVRNLGKVFLLPFDLAIGLELKDKRFIRYFDKFSGTTVIDLKP